MKFVLVHLSDIHLQNSNDWILDKSPKIVSALKSYLFSHTIDALLVVISGDIANRGTSEQYKIALEFFSGLRQEISDAIGVDVKFVVVPGNHDCNFADTPELDLRDLAIKAVLENPDAHNEGEQIYEKCLSVQRDFFEFLGKLEPDLQYPATPQVLYKVEIEATGKRIVFNCFNSAWLTQLKETQGKLLLPKSAANRAKENLGTEDIAISVYHHPENWLEAENAGDIRATIRTVSDFVMTGHEHRREVFTEKPLEDSGELLIQRAGALQDRDKQGVSRFSLTLIDFANEEFHLQAFNWSDTDYKASGNKNIHKFERNERLLEGRFELKDDFRQRVSNLSGVPISHPKKRTLQVDDLFVSPRLQQFSFENIVDGKRPGRAIPAAEFLLFILKKKKVVLYGETTQGKSTAAKYAFLRLREKGVVPIFLDGNTFTSSSPTKLEKAIETAVSEQFVNVDCEIYKGLDSSKMAVVIDDFGIVPSQQSDLQAILSFFGERFGTVVAVAHSNLHIQQYVANEQGEVKFSVFEHAEIRPFNRAERSALIRKWLAIGGSGLTDEEFERNLLERRNAIEAGVQTSMVIPFPSFVLGFLQVSDSMSRNIDTNRYGTLGFLYQSLITDRFRQTAESDDLDLGQTYVVLGNLARISYQHDSLDVSEDDIRDATIEYTDDTGLPIHPPDFTQLIEAAGILTRSTGRWQFASPQLRDYFVAEDLSRRMGHRLLSVKDEAMSRVDEIIATLTYESHTRILLFLVFKAYNKPEFIEKVLAVAEKIFSEFTPTDFEKDISFLNEIKTDLQFRPMLVEGPAHKRLKDLDDAYDQDCEVNGLTRYDDRAAFSVEYRADLDIFVKAAMALKMIEVLGQLVRSFASTLDKDLRKDIVKSCIDVGLRFLTSMYQIRDDEVTIVQNILRELIKEKHSNLSDAELTGRANAILLFNFHGLTYGVLRKISYSMGAKDLKGDFSELLDKPSATTQDRIMLSAIKLENYADPGVDNLIRFGKDLIEDNPFLRDVLRQLVASYMNFYGVSNAQERQKIQAAFELEGGNLGLANTEIGERKYLNSKGSRFQSPQEKRRGKT